MHWKVPLLLLAGLLFGIGLGIIFVFSGRTTPAGPQVGKSVPEFPLESLDGQKPQWRDYQGQPILINFWATWCLPCKDELPLLAHYQRILKGKMQILAVDGGETAETIKSFLNFNAISLNVFLDLRGDIAKLYQVHGYPSSFFVDRDGILRAVHIGELTDELMTRYLQTIGVTP